MVNQNDFVIKRELLQGLKRHDIFLKNPDMENLCLWINPHDISDYFIANPELNACNGVEFQEHKLNINGSYCGCGLLSTIKARHKGEKNPYESWVEKDLPLILKGFKVKTKQF